MAPVELTTRYSNALPLIYFTGVSIVSFGCLLTIIHSFFNIRRELPISARTRAYQNKRRNDVILFSILAGISLLVQSYNVVETLVDSYSNFVLSSKVVPKLDPWTSFLWYPRDNSFAGLQLNNWWKSGELERSLVAFGTSARDYWWFQQLQVSTVLWTIFAGIEGHRRNIPRLWAFIPLVTVFGLSFAQNIFFIALLLTPVPYVPASKSRSKSAKSSGRIAGLLKKLHILPSTDRPATWTPDAEVYLMPLLLSMICVAALPYVNDHLYSQWLTIDRQILWFIPLIVSHTNLLPNWLGTHHPTIHAAHASTKPIFRTAAVLALIIHTFATYSAIATNTSPSNLRTRFRFFSTEEPATTTISRYGQGVGRVLGAFSDSPLVQLVVWDVILSGVSLCAWAATRGLNPSSVFSAFGFPSEKEKEVITKKAKAISATVASTSALSKSAPRKTSSKRGRPSKAEMIAVRDESSVDGNFRPSSSVAALEKGTEHDEHFEAVQWEDGAESAALVWGVLVVAGLGGAMAGVCGGEAGV